MKELRAAVKYISISKIEIPEEMEFQKDYRIELIGSMVKREQGDKQDGSGDVTYKFKPTAIVVNEN